MISILAAAAATVATPTPAEVATALFASFNRHDMAALTKLYAENAEIISSDACGIGHGPAAIAASHQQIFDTFPNGKDDVVSMVVQGDRVAVEFVFTGTVKGNAVRLPIAAFLTVRDGKIVRDAAYFDADPSPDCSKP